MWVSAFWLRGGAARFGLAAALLCCSSAPALAEPDLQISEPVLVRMPLEPEGATASPPPLHGDVAFTCDTNKGGKRDGHIFSESAANGAVGPRAIVVTSSGAVGVYRRPDCKGVTFLSLHKFFAAFDLAPPPQVLLGNARVIYDPTVRRFFVATGTVRDDLLKHALFFAVSTDDRAREWHVYRVVLQDDTTLFCKERRDTLTQSQRVAGRSAGVDGRWFLTTNEGRPPEPFLNSIVLSISKSDTLDGRPARIKCLRTPDAINVNMAPPVVLDDADTAYFLAASSTIGLVNRVNRFALKISKNGPSGDRFKRTGDIEVPIETAAPPAQQPNGLKFYVATPEFRHPTIQIGDSLWNVRQTREGDFARWRLYRYSKTAAEPLWSYTPSTVKDGDDHTFSASVAVDSDEPDARVYVNFGRTIPSGGADREARAVMMMGAGRAGAPKSWKFTVVSVSDFEYRPFNASISCSAIQIEPPVPCSWTRQSAIQIDPDDRHFVWGFNQLAEGLRDIDWVVSAGQVEWR